MTETAEPTRDVPWSAPRPLTLTKINAARVALGGILAGIVHFFAMGLVNGIVLAPELQAWLHETGGLLHPPAQPISMSLWALMSLIYGVIGVWLYAAIRSRFGAGPKTAVLSGLSLWVVSKFTVALDFITLGAIPLKIIAGQTIGGLLAIVIAVLLRAWFYKE